MKEREIDVVFANNGYGHLYDHLKTPIDISGILSESESDVLDCFLEAFDYSHYDRLFFDEFRYYFSIFQRIYYQMNE